MTDLATLANWAELIAAAVVVGGVVFAIAEVRNFQRQRLEAAAMELMRAWQSPDFTRGRDNVYEWIQWLAERLEDLPDYQAGSPAYLAHRDWRP